MFAKYCWRFSLLTCGGTAGYVAGRFHEKGQCLNNGSWFEWDTSILSKVFAATITERHEFKGEIALPEQKTEEIEIRSDTTTLPAPSRISQIMKYGFPSLENIRSLDDFVLSYDKRNRTANWVFEHLTRETTKYNEQVDRSKCDFYEDESIHPYFRSRNSDYKGSGFDRGHLAAAGNHKAQQKHCEQTFVLSNISPQVGNGFNRHAWNRLEQYVRKLTKTHPNVYVCTGPLYLPRVESDGKSYVKYQVIGANTVAVPTHFFKVVAMEATDGSLEMEAYVMPNDVISDDTPLKVFQVPLESIERASGLLFFDKVPRDKFRRINGKK